MRSFRPTRGGWGVALLGLGLLAAAVNTGNNLIYLLLGLLAATVPVSFVASTVQLRRLGVRLKFPTAPRAGSPFALDVGLDNHGTGIVRSLVVSVLGDRRTYGPAFVPQLAAEGTLRVPILVPGESRGAVMVRAVRLRTWYPLGLFERSVRFPIERELLVLPPGGRRHTAGTVRVTHAGAGRPSRRIPGTEYAGLRRARHQDDSRSVDWKVTARRGVVMVRETTGEGRRDVELNADTRPVGEPRIARRAFEENLARLAAQAATAVDQGGAVGLSVDGRDRRVYAGQRGLMQLLRRLARLTPRAPDGTPLRRPAPGGGARPREPLTRRGGAAAAHRAAALLAVLIGCAVLFAFGGIGPLVFGGFCLSWVGTTFRPGLIAAAGSTAERLWKLVALTALVFFFGDLLFFRHDLLSASSSLLVFVLFFALFNAREIADDRRILRLSLLPMIMAAALTTDLAIALPLLCWLAVVVFGAMHGTALPPAGASIAASGRATPMAAASLLVTTCLVVIGLVAFALVPHLGTGTFRPGALRARASTGFSDSARLGDIGRIKLNNARVMEVEVAGSSFPEGRLRWRGLALDRFDGREWTRSPAGYTRMRADDRGRFRVHELTPGSTGTSVVQQVRLEPTGTAVLFAAPGAREVVSSDFRFLGRDGSGGLELHARPGRRLSYTVHSDLPASAPSLLRTASGEDPPQVLEAYLDLPPLDPRIAELVRHTTAGTSTRYDAASAIESWLADNLDYSLDVRDAGSADPLAAFLFDGLAGHCEYFATAMVVLARAGGIPARYVTGYLRGEKSRFGNRYVVRQSDAHAWVEVYFPDRGWVTFDPTPPDGRVTGASPGMADLALYVYSSLERWWDDYLIGIDLDDQGRWLLGTLNAVLVGAGNARAALGSPAGWAAIGLLVAVALAVRRGRLGSVWARLRARGAPPRRRRSMPAFYARLLELLSRKGLSPAVGETAAEFADRAAGALTTPGACALRELTRLYHRVRFDRQADLRELEPFAQALIGDVKGSFRDA